MSFEERTTPATRTNWQTPDSFLELVRQVGSIGLDPCTTEDNPTGAAHYFDEADDGLVHTWGDMGLIYVNPPYGREIGPWVARMAEEGSMGEEIVALVPARTDTKWFGYVTTADEICFLRGRLKFKGAKDCAKFPSCVAYWGPQRARFRDVFRKYGWLR